MVSFLVPGAVKTLDSLLGSGSGQPAGVRLLGQKRIIQCSCRRGAAGGGGGGLVRVGGALPAFSGEHVAVGR